MKEAQRQANDIRKSLDKAREDYKVFLGTKVTP